MDIKILVGAMLQIGFGVLMVRAGYKRLRDVGVVEEKDARFWRMASKIGLFLGWFIIIYSLVYLISYIALSILRM